MKNTIKPLSEKPAIEDKPGNDFLKDRERNFLPKWTQQTLGELRQEIAQLNSEIDRLKQAHSILFERECDGAYRLFYLSSDGAHVGSG